MDDHRYGHPYDPNCAHCKPALIDVETGTPFPDDHPDMITIMRVWNASPFEERRAFIAVTADSSKQPRDLAAAEPLMQRVRMALKKAGQN